MNPWLARNAVYRPATWLRREPVFRILKQYEASQWWTPAELAARQEHDLREILRFAARSSPYYAELALSAGLDPDHIEAEDLERFPPLTKAELVGRAQDLHVPLPAWSYSWKTTGGSTGVPVRLRKDRWATATEQAASWRSYAWYGVAPGDRQARFWGTPLTGSARLRAQSIDWVLNRDRFSAFAFRREDLRAYFERVRQMRPAWAYGYVSMLAQFARYCLEEALPLAGVGLRAVVTTSEVLSDADRAIIAEAFGAPVFNEYGCGEVGAVLYECEKGLLHLMSENLHAELVPDPTLDHPDARRLVLTDLHNRATPLIRYEINDRVVPAPPCACGRGLPAFSSIFGRAYDFVEAEDGRQFHGEFFLYHIEEARDAGVPIVQVQFVQEEGDGLLVRIVPGPGFETRHGDDLSRRLRDKSQGAFTVRIETVDAIERERSGKIRLIRARPSSSAS